MHNSFADQHFQPAPNNPPSAWCPQIPQYAQSAAYTRPPPFGQQSAGSVDRYTGSSVNAQILFPQADHLHVPGPLGGPPLSRSPSPYSLSTFEGTLPPDVYNPAPERIPEDHASAMWENASYISAQPSRVSSWRSARPFSFFKKIGRWMRPRPQADILPRGKTDPKTVSKPPKDNGTKGGPKGGSSRPPPNRY